MGKTISLKVDVEERGRAGGYASAKKLSASQRKEKAQNAARARWGKPKAKKGKKANAKR